MRFFLLFLFLIQGFYLSSQSIAQKTEELSSSSAVKNGRFSFYAKNLETGEVIIEKDKNRRMSPASTLKLLTTYAAMDILGVDHRFTTKIGYAGELDENGLLIGDIVVQAGGDPALGADDFMNDYGNGAPIERQVAIAIKQAGISSIEGRIIIDETIYEGIDVPDEWTWQDMGNYYAAGAHALTFKENMFKVDFRSSSKPGVLTEIENITPSIPDLDIKNHVESASIRSDQAFFYSSPDSDILKMYGKIPVNQKQFEVKGAMPNPALVFRQAIKKQLVNSGIQIMERNLPRPDVLIWQRDVFELIRFESPPLEKLIAYTNMKSNNLYAEHFLRQIGKRKKGEGSYGKGIEAIIEWCNSKNIDTKGLRIKDGSGLSRANSVCARLFVELLTSLFAEDYYHTFRDGLPIAGRSGSMRRVGQGSPIEGKVFAKTGYIEDARAYSGFLELDDQTIVFSIMANDYELSASQMRNKMAELIGLLAK